MDFEWRRVSKPTHRWVATVVATVLLAACGGCGGKSKVRGGRDTATDCVSGLVCWHPRCEPGGSCSGFCKIPCQQTSDCPSGCICSQRPPQCEPTFDGGTALGDC